MDSIAPEPNFSGISRYRVEKQIGAGGGGRVFKAWDEKLQRTVALKRIDKAVLPDGRSAAQEALHLSSLKHPNIVTIHDFAEDADGPYVVLEYVDGERLSDVIQRGALPLEEFSLFAQQCLDALAAAHAQGLLHRDLKPDNLMVQWLPNGGFQVKVLDFGLAKVVAVPQAATCQQDGTYVGTIYTMSPEALQKAPVDARSDLYSLGCVFYFALTQHMPFTGETISDVVVSHLQHQVVPLEQYRPDLPPIIIQWVKQFIEVDPSQRFHGATQALAILARLLQQRREEAVAPPPKAEPVVRRSQDSAPPKGVSWMAWAAVVITMAGLAVWFFGGDRKNKEEAVATPAPEARPALAAPITAKSALPDAKAIAAMTQGGSVVATPAVPPAAVVESATPPPSTPAPVPASVPPAAPKPAVAATPSAPATGGPVTLQFNDLEGARAHLGQEVIVEGSTLALTSNKAGDIRYLNFERNFRNSISIVFFVTKNPTELDPEKLLPYVGQHVRVRGVVEQYKESLQIKVKTLTQIEIVP